MNLSFFIWRAVWRTWLSSAVSLKSIIFVQKSVFLKRELEIDIINMTKNRDKIESEGTDNRNNAEKDIKGGLAVGDLFAQSPEPADTSDTDDNELEGGVAPQHGEDPHYHESESAAESKDGVEKALQGFFAAIVRRLKGLFKSGKSLGTEDKKVSETGKRIKKNNRAESSANGADENEEGNPRKRNTFWRYATKKHRVSIRDIDRDEEVNYVYISALKFVCILLGTLVVLFGLVFLLVIYTPIIDVVPGYPGKKARKAITENVFRLDSMNNELEIVERYLGNVTTIMEGRVPAPVSTQYLSDSIPTPKLLGPDSMDMVLRSEMESSGRYALLAANPSVAQKIQSMGFRTPVTGDVVRLFNPTEGLYGVGIYVHVSQQVQASQAGTVISAVWSPEIGNIVQIQHKDNFISTYKNMTSMLKKMGDRVEVGEAIGQINASMSSKENPFVFELWYGGQPVDPQRYILISTVYSDTE